MRTGKVMLLAFDTQLLECRVALHCLRNMQEPVLPQVVICQLQLLQRMPRLKQSPDCRSTGVRKCKATEHDRGERVSRMSEPCECLYLRLAAESNKRRIMRPVAAVNLCGSHLSESRLQRVGRQLLLQLDDPT